MKGETDSRTRVRDALIERFGSSPEVDRDLLGIDELARMAEHRSHRKFSEREISPSLLQLLLACALSAPSKSDLQQADILHIADRKKIRAIADGIPDMPWIARAPVFLVFCGNNRRIRQIGEWRNKPFVNDHLDHFMNAAVDAALVMMNFIRAAEAVGLGTCPISAVRNRCDEVSRLLGLPEQVFPVAAMCVGYPESPGRISPRLPLDVTIHRDAYGESVLREEIDAYDRRRHAIQPYRRQRAPERFPEVAFYGWSEEKARQYAVPERADFGAYIRKIGFTLK